METPARTDVNNLSKLTLKNLAQIYDHFKEVDFRRIPK